MRWMLVGFVGWLVLGPAVFADPVARFFGDPGGAGYEGCFAVAELDGTVVLRSGGEACAERYPPCSTFKIPNSLIGLETGVVKRDTVFPWDGTDLRYEVWERDHDLASAIRHSVVWYYQELARRVGAETMQSWVDRFEYGNRDLSGGLTRFWLGSTLTISADEQLRFLSKLYTGALPVSAESAATVKEILLFDEGPGWALHAKTGSCHLEGDDTLGWWVGHVRRGEVERLFVTRIRSVGADGREARKLTLRMLADPKVAAAMGIEPIEARVR